MGLYCALFSYINYPHSNSDYLNFLSMRFCLLNIFMSKCFLNLLGFLEPILEFDDGLISALKQTNISAYGWISSCGCRSAVENYCGLDILRWDTLRKNGQSAVGYILRLGHFAVWTYCSWTFCGLDTLRSDILRSGHIAVGHIAALTFLGWTISNNRLG